ncbi:phosphate/phosphite/phosphonate ABC transporter substrate-binding protein [Roseateles puraquae]|jgi:phosphonate transport system substrate-binding protein|nr:phosphate/phosphite/phosphonate ABC transporter substrate-binding protein [Roseateles puraquae]
MSRRHFLLQSAALLAGALPAPAIMAQSRKLRFGVGPFMPTAEDTRKAFLPLFAHIAKSLGAPDFDLAVSTDWAGLAVAMGSGQLDAAWMGPWGYVIANNATDCQAIATVKYDDKPTYQAIIVGRPDISVARFPDDTRGRSISFADVGSTSGWLIPTFYASKVWKIDPKAFWKYSEGASHPANEVAVASGQVDLATDYDRNRNAMIAAGRIKPDATKIVWTSDPLPNDAFAVPKQAPREFTQQLQSILLALSGDAAKALMPPRYTGFVAATHASYKMIEDAGLAIGRIKARG